MASDQQANGSGKMIQPAWLVIGGVVLLAVLMALFLLLSDAHLTRRWHHGNFSGQAGATAPVLFSA